MNGVPSPQSPRIVPGPNQESVWDYPRPPRLEDAVKEIQVVFNGVAIASTTRAKRVLETSHPPVYYLPLEDVQPDVLLLVPGATSYCEWKGRAQYYTIAVGERRAERAAWFYPDPVPAFLPIKDYIAFYPSRMDACYVNGELVQTQAGDFYGGWITSEIVGPFKGGPGTWGW